MREVILGIKDYLKDYIHDTKCRILLRFSPDFQKYWETDQDRVFWKEGSMLHYIRQRRIAKKPIKLKPIPPERVINFYKNRIKTLEKELKALKESK